MTDTKSALAAVVDAGNRLEEVAGRPDRFMMDERIRALKDWRKVRDEALKFL